MTVPSCSKTFGSPSLPKEVGQRVTLPRTNAKRETAPQSVGVSLLLFYFQFLKQKLLKSISTVSCGLSVKMFVYFFL